jgi:hypothetical protein
VDLSPTEQSDIREYRVEPDYRTRADARAAVACLASEQGIFELLRFRGQPPPAGYKSFWEVHNRPVEKQRLKRKEPDDHDDRDDAPPGNRNNKRQRVDLPNRQEEKGEWSM